jgi:hypothetical protein
MTHPSGYDFDVKQFGAVGDGVTDDTAAIQAAIDAAGERAGSVWLPTGVYACGTLRMHHCTALVALPTWSYHRTGGVTLKLNDPNASCLIDLNCKTGVRISGLSLDGGKLGENIAGIFHDGLGHEEEDTLVIENTRIAHFSGDAITLRNVWAYTVRDCMMIFCGGNGLTITRWDGFLYHNIINNCQGYGIAFLSPNSAVTIIGNRIEWNYKGGIFIEHGGHYTINDNYFDRAGGPAVHLEGDDEHRGGVVAITGNMFSRSGAKVALDSEQCSHVLLEYADGVVMTGNTFRIGVNDSGEGQRSPSYGIVARSLRSCIIRDNVLHRGATRELLRDAGGHEDTILDGNVGIVAE